jgi:hypothetical protein
VRLHAYISSLVSLTHDNVVNSRPLKRSLAESSPVCASIGAETEAATSSDDQIQGLDASCDIYAPDEIFDHGSKRRRTDPPAVSPNHNTASITVTRSQFFDIFY